MWRKLLIVCVFGAFSCQWAVAAIAGHDAATPIDEYITADASSLGERRIALVIGNAGYQNDPLRNPVNDARTMSDTLRMLGFDVVHVENANGQRMQAALREFNRRLAIGGIGLFYFAGHGFQVADKTVLAPIDADSRVPAGLLTKGISLQDVLESMSRSRPGKRNLVILDTCLNNPFGKISGSSHATVPAPPAQTLIAYAAAPGALAADYADNGVHGLYTAELLKALAAPGKHVSDMFRRVASAVRHASGGRQVPWVSSSLSSDFQFAAATPRTPMPSDLLPVWRQAESSVVEAARSRAILPKDSAEQYELTFWDSIKDSNHISDYEAYLQAYPKGRFAALARARIERLRAAAPKAEKPAEEARPAPATKAPPERARPAPATKAPAERERPAAKPPEQARPAPATPAPAAPQAQEKLPAPATGISELKDCPTCPAMIALPAGTFTMGSNSGDPSEKPAHRVSIAAPFAIGKYEVTVEQWNACADAGACPRVANGESRPATTPVRDVSWDDVQQYVKWLSKVSGKSYRLPTEAEWEYAARGGTATRYWWGEQMRKGTANCKDCGEPWDQNGPANVGSFAANPYGLHDMNGSVWEWVSDCWHNSFKGAPADGRNWDTPNCRDRVIRGGSWREDASYMPSSTRFKYAASVRHSQNGFRVARDHQ